MDLYVSVKCLFIHLKCEYAHTESLTLLSLNTQEPGSFGSLFYPEKIINVKTLNMRKRKKQASIDI